MNQEIVMDADHIGYAVRNIENAKKLFSVLGYSFGKTQTDEVRNVNVCVGTRGGGTGLSFYRP